MADFSSGAGALTFQHVGTFTFGAGASHSITLTSGKRYWIDAIITQGGSNDTPGVRLNGITNNSYKNNDDGSAQNTTFARIGGTLVAAKIIRCSIEIELVGTYIRYTILGLNDITTRIFVVGWLDDAETSITSCTFMQNGGNSFTSIVAEVYEAIA